MADFRLIGLYSIVPTIESLVIAARFHRYDWLINNNEYIGDVARDELENLGLLEFQVSGGYSPAELLNINHNNQAPYLEFYLNEAGDSFIDESNAVNLDGFRVCFFLHFIDTSEPLFIGKQKIKMPEMSVLPNRLLPFAHYVPVD